MYIRLIVAGNEIRCLDLIGALDFFRPKAQVGNRDAAGLLGVVGKVCLYIGVRVVSDNFDCGLAPTVPSEPSPQNLQEKFLDGVESKTGENSGRERWVTSSVMETVKPFLG